MIKKRERIIALVLIFILSVSTAAYSASWEDFTDVSGHWAEETMKKGIADELISGFEDNTVRPDAPITTAQMITILCRVLNATETADTSALGLPADTWYLDAAGKALYLGLISPATGNLDAPMSRQNALSMLAKAFCLVPAAPDLSVLNGFSDLSSVTAENRGAMAALVSKQLIQGFAGSLNANNSITRSEFLTVLYRVAANYTDSGALGSDLSGGTVVKGSLSLYNTTLSAPLYMDCSSSSATLSSVNSSSDIVLLSHKLSSLNVSSSSLQRLTVAGGSYNISFTPYDSTAINVLQLHGSGSASVSGSGVAMVEVSGKNVSLTLSGEHDSLIVGGSGNTVTLKEDCDLGKLIILGDGNKVIAPNSLAALGEVSISGSGNSLVTENAAKSSALPAIGSIKLGGSGNSYVSYCALGAIGGISVDGSGNQLIISGEGLAASTGNLEVSGSKHKLQLNASGSTGAVSVTGDGSSVSVNGTVAAPAVLSGSGNQLFLTSAEALASASVSGNGNWLTLNCLDMDSLAIDGTFNTVHKTGTGSIASLSIPGKNNVFVLYVENSVGTGTVTGSDNNLTVNGTVSQLTVDGRKLTLSGSGTVSALTLNATGSKISAAVTKLTDNSHQKDEDRILKLVTPVYKGNYTLQWALDNDYEDYEKEIFVNAKGYSSKTPYLLWINLANQRVNIFEGSKGNWTLIRESLCGSGAPGSGTPVGVYDITYKLASGWNTSSYTCKPVVGFKRNSGYAFHSRLYYPNSTKLKDPSIGFPVSAGCIRMYDEDINYIYNSMPIGSTVVVY